MRRIVKRRRRRSMRSRNLQDAFCTRTKARGNRLHKALVAAISVSSPAAFNLSLPGWAYVPGQIVAVVVVQGRLGDDRRRRPKMKQNAHYNLDKADDHG